MPGGCVEQNLASMTLPVIATLYLDRTNTWQSVGVQRRAEAIGYIQKGERTQQTYNMDGWMDADVVFCVFRLSKAAGVQKERRLLPPLQTGRCKYMVMSKNNVTFRVRKNYLIFIKD